MANQNPERQLDHRTAADVAQNTARHAKSPRENRRQPGDDNRKQGAEQQRDRIQGGGGGNKGGGGRSKRAERIHGGSEQP